MDTAGGLPWRRDLQVFSVRLVVVSCRQSMNERTQQGGCCRILGTSFTGRRHDQSGRYFDHTGVQGGT